MQIVLKVTAACLAGVLLVSCGGRRAARAEKDAFMHRQGFACTTPAVCKCG